MSKFKKKIALQGGNSLKIFGADAGIEFSKSPHIAIINTGEIGMENKKFKTLCVLMNLKEITNENHYYLI